MVVWYKFQKGCDDYKEIEKKAKKSKLGIWSDPSFEMPWDYRTKMGIGFRGLNNTLDKKVFSSSSAYQKTTVKNTALKTQNNS